jgi:hypothetical protein
LWFRVEILALGIEAIGLFTEIYFIRTHVGLLFPPFLFPQSCAVLSHYQGWNMTLAENIRPVMSPAERQLLYRYLTGVNTYFEFGSGGSTAQAAIRARKVISVESDAAWHAALRARIGPAPHITWYTVDLKVPFNGWGYPGPTSPRSDWPNYTHAYEADVQADVILIDGRFRVSCALCVFSKISRRTYVIMHDFRPRRYYWVILKWYDLIEIAHTLAVFQKKEDVSPPPENLIQWYDQQPGDSLMPGLAVPRWPSR